ncbi:MAG: nucleotidyltransferase domain-containing protein [Candidatus Latescibacterota bacterium]
MRGLAADAEAARQRQQLRQGRAAPGDDASLGHAVRLAHGERITGDLGVVVHSAPGEERPAEDRDVLPGSLTTDILPFADRTHGREAWGRSEGCVDWTGVMFKASDAPLTEREMGHSYAAGQVARARARERVRQGRRASLREAARRAAEALRARHGEGFAVYLFGSVLDAGRFRVNSDLDLAVEGLPPDRYYEAWAEAEAAAGSGCLDLVRLEDAPDWLAAQVRAHGEQLL